MKIWKYQLYNCVKCVDFNRVIVSWLTKPSNLFKNSLEHSSGFKGKGSVGILVFKARQIGKLDINLWATKYNFCLKYIMLYKHV